ncbi:LacI family DNA-binding transcriptional regulator [Xylophilus sp. GOD-11R]|uniref:LacI family DNA-binding transcriptional regulator n=1 Tax=Xylophilus sp. GOD-11R TaxID=3089814 RepID=UPI00298D403A|nr:LacI family DNA-binding transcriptional regulator [Xylophilus sp. GOD-11R]WPB57471.1 LacI family DNA-binding transcriptional regulator [Xylophilus sp. GOD-11R]
MQSSDPPPKTRKRPHNRAAAITTLDVAAMAGVSAMTVSRVLNTPDKVAPATVARVREAIERTGFVPNMLAGALSSQRTRLIAAIVPEMANTMFAKTIQAFCDVMAAAGYQVLFGLSGYPHSQEDSLLSAILARRPDALYLTGIERSQETRRRLLAAKIPVVECWDLTPTPLDMVVGFSHADCGRAIAGHLLAKGHRRIGAVWADDARAGMRLRHLQRTLAEAGAPPAIEAISAAPSTLRAGREGLARLLDAGHRLDAIACSSDALAQGVLAGVLSRGLRIPQDLAVIGFGDVDAAASTYPTLTTVRIESAAMGRLAAEGLLRRLSGDESGPKVSDTGFSIVERESA